MCGKNAIKQLQQNVYIDQSNREKLIENLSMKCGECVQSECQYLPVFEFYEFHGMTEHIHLHVHIVSMRFRILMIYLHAIDMTTMSWTREQRQKHKHICMQWLSVDSIRLMSAGALRTHVTTNRH